ncbi:hypothetical protein Tsubulata_003941 [Turnera subulata]|uniref:DNA ligase n=1 Tax=Turnera subulata TaxID=218843 RepID=A0A9Q0GD81_9ROSI|nr:hypothetical protein Tsubulata_003941 [Turnera subulata]
MSTDSPPIQTLDSLRLYHAALSSLSLPLPPPPPPSLPPPPPSKLIPNTHFLVDSFRPSSATSTSTTAFFLSHFHSDHYSGLSSSWSHGIVFCSPLTSSLLTQILKIPPPLVCSIPLGSPVLIDGSEVTLIDANHCPGAVQFLFKVPISKDLSRFETYVHTGDCRFNSEMKNDPILLRFVGCNAVFLDTTYCNPKFVFPKQEESVDYVVSVIEKVAGGGKKVGGGLEKGVLFLVATYVVGKERILLEIARRCKRKVVVDARKMEVLRVLGYGESGVFTEDENESDVHVVGWNVLGETWPYFRPNFVKMKEIMVEKGYSSVVGFVPTGWTYEVKKNKFAVRVKDSFEIHLVPYSEHSSYDELREYVRFLRPKRVIPTVGADVENSDSKHVRKMQKHFAGLVDEMANKKDFLMGFHRSLSEKEEKIERIAVSGINEMQDLENEGKDVSDILQEPASQNLNELDDEQAEKIIQELSHCLPTWVTREQMLDLISISGANIVESVSIFYERETEFHEQVCALKSTISLPETRSQDECESLPKSVPIKSDHGGFGILLSQTGKSPKAKPPVKSRISPGKRKKSNDGKSAKKIRSNPKLESGGSKQSTITRFFNKVGPGVSQDVMVESISEKCPTDEKLLQNSQNSGNKLYREEIEQFIQIIEGNESSRDYAATILETTKGDINKALDMHYGNPKANHTEIGETSVLSGNLVHVQCQTDEHLSTVEKVFLEQPGDSIDLTVRGSPTENVDKNLSVGKNLVSLPPEKYDPVKHACWMAGQPAPYVHLAQTFELVEAEKGRIKATSILCNMFRSLLALSPDDVLPAVYLCTNKIAADHENMELNIGGSLVTSALEEACGTKRSKIRDMYNTLGDLGDVAQVCRQTQTLLAPCPPLIVKDVFSTLRKISEDLNNPIYRDPDVQTGSGSVIRKKSFIVNLMRSCREKEMKFIVRTLVRNLRIGAMMRTILPALAQAVAMNYYSSNELKAENLKDKLQSLSAAVVEAYNILPSLDLLVPSIIKEGAGFSSSNLSMIPGIPIKPMLAKITNGVAQVLTVFQNKSFTCEFKYDGQRAQIHKMADGSMRVFSRNGDETTSRFPDLIKIIQESCKPTAATFILDAEVVAVDRKNGCKLMSFQELSSRERGGKESSIAVNDIKVDICVFVFDIMFANGEQLLGSPLRYRRKCLKDLFRDERAGYFEYAKEMTVEAHDSYLTNEVISTKIDAFLRDALHSSCEGVMVKALDVDALYAPSKRTDTWLKVKRDYVEGMNDSLDLVPIGAWYGNGRKAGWYSPFLMACYNPETENFQSVCRVMSGFSDAFYIEMKEFFSGDRILSKKPLYYETAEVPDLWFAPEVVWEIRGADFTVSPVHQAAVGLVHPSRGISVRFPRFISCVSDRNPEECSTAADIADMFNSQTRKMDVSAGD